MDNNTFALFVLGLGTIIIAIVIWQIFATARARMHLTRTPDAQQLTEHWQHDQQQLESRLRALAEDVQAIERRVRQLEPPTRS